MAMNERKKRGLLLIAIGIVLILTHYLGLDMAFLMGGVVFVALGFGDIFYDKRYRRRF
jgi:hypothetical protein